MKAYLCSRNFTLRHTDFDFKDELKLSSYLSLAQEAAGESAEELHFGEKDLFSKNLGFIIVNTYCEVLRPVKFGETVTLETWPLPPRRVFFERHYRFVCEGEPVANAASRWCLVGLDDFSLKTGDALGEAHTACPYRSETALVVPVWKIPKLTDGREIYRLRVGNSHCDHFMHANNTRYADFFSDCFTAEELRRVASFQIAYGKQAKEGAELIFYRQDFGAESVCEAHCNGECFAQFRIRFQTEKCE